MPRNRIKMSAVCLRYSLLTNLSFRWLISFQLYTRNIRLNPSKDTSTKIFNRPFEISGQMHVFARSILHPRITRPSNNFQGTRTRCTSLIATHPDRQNNFKFHVSSKRANTRKQRITRDTGKKNKCCVQSDTSLRNADQNPETRFALREVLCIPSN